MSGSEWIPGAGTMTRGRDVQLESPDRLLPPVALGCGGLRVGWPQSLPSHQKGLRAVGLGLEGLVLRQAGHPARLNLETPRPGKRQTREETDQAETPVTHGDPLPSRRGARLPARLWSMPSSFPTKSAE